MSSGDNQSGRWDTSVTSNAFNAMALDILGYTLDSMEDTADVYNLVAVFPVAATSKVAIGLQNKDEEGAATDITGWYANVTYKFQEQKNVSLFAEIADTDKANSDLGYLAGMQFKF